jgi:PAS domain S-box-containing protein
LGIFGKNYAKLRLVQERKSKITLLILGTSSLCLFITLVLLQASNVWKKIVVETATDTLILYALSSLNFIAFIIFTFIFIRNLLKLLRERKALQLGSKIKLRLLFHFFAVSLLPIIAMALFSYLFMNRAVERWFTNIPENVVRNAYQVQQEALQAQTSSLIEKAHIIAYSLEKADINDEVLTEIARKTNLIKIVCLSKDNKILAQSTTEAAEEPQVLQNYLSIVESDESVFPTTDGYLVIVEKLSNGKKLLIVPDTYSSNKNLSQIAENALKEFDKLKSQQVTVRQIGLSTLGLLTFLLIFASSWMAFYVARGLTVPIKALAEGASEIAQGNLAYRVNVLAEDELAILVDSFNQMASKLQSNAEELEKRRKYIETILESLSTGVISLDSENRIATINKAARQILRLESTDFKGLQLSDLLNSETFQIVEKVIKRAKRTGTAFEQTMISSDNLKGQSFESIESNERYPVALTATLLPDNGVVLVIEDLTELIAAQRAAAWSEVARRMAHEIKNPLTPIQLSAERILRKFQAESENSQSRLRRIVEESTETILSEVRSLKAMVDEFSKFAKLPDTKLETGNLNDVVKRTISLYKDRLEDIEIISLLDENLPCCLLDKEQMKQVLVNLIENAIEAFEGIDGNNKTIIVSTKFNEKQGKIFAEVADNAKGISPKDFPKLFQPYFSTKARGTGLGLTIVNRILSEHGGKIKVTKNFPKGTRFIIELPV